MIKWKSKAFKLILPYMALFLMYINLRNISTLKTKTYKQLNNPTHTEFIYLIGKFSQNNSTV